MILSITVNYCLTLWITQKREEKEWIKSRKPVLLLGVVINLAILFYFKYYDFFLSTMNDVFKTDMTLKHILLPLGISFFTFQQIGFLVDCYRNENKEVNFIDYALFVSFFPQLIAGPIVSSEEMLPQFATIKGRRFDTEKFAKGLTLFVLGLAKKVLIADTLGRGVDTGFASIGAINGLDSFLVMIWYTLQLYFDFSGYCDMARGLALMLGFELPVNFDSPYKSSNIIEFWSRWHKTLTRFFTKYVYIPLGGNRKGFVRMLINILIIYFLSGLWHGAGYNFILWGMLHGVLYVIARIVQRLFGAQNDKTTDVITKNNTFINAIFKGIGIAFTFLYVSFAWVFFRAESISQGCDLILNMFTKEWNFVTYSISQSMKMDELWYVIKFLHLDRYSIAQNLVMIIITVFALIVTFVAPNAAEVSSNIKGKKLFGFMLGMLGVWCILTLSNVSTFLYFNF